MMKNGVLILRKAHFLNCIPCARHWPMLFTSIISSYSHSAPMRQALLSSFFYMQGCWSWDLLKVTQQVSGNKWHSLSDLRTILLESLCPPPKMMHYISSSVLQLIIIYARQTNPSVILYFHIYHCCCLVTQSCLTLCDPMNCSIPGFPVFHYLPELLKLMSVRQWCHPTIPS